MWRVYRQRPAFQFAELDANRFGLGQSCKDRQRRPGSAAGGFRHRSLNKIHQAKREQRCRNDDVAQLIEVLQFAPGTLPNDHTRDYGGDTAGELLH
jgi:hypothetical protein